MEDASIVIPRAGTLARMDFQARLAHAMSARSVSITQLARELGVSFQAIKAVLDGSTKALKAENCAKAARFLGVNGHWLATGEGEQQPAKEEQEMALTPDEKDLVIAMRVLMPEERAAVMERVLSMAQDRVRQLDAVIARRADSKPQNVVKLQRP